MASSPDPTPSLAGGIPSAHEIAPFIEDLDESKALEHFLGKDLDGAEQLFRSGSSCYMADLIWMGPTGFRYYVFAAIRYLQSKEARGDSYAPRGFALALEARVRTGMEDLLPIVQQLADACRYILVHLQEYDLAPGIDDDLHPRYEELVKKLSRAAAAQRAVSGPDGPKPGGKDVLPGPGGH